VSVAQSEWWGGLLTAAAACGGLLAAAVVVGCEASVACVDTDSRPPLCYESSYCYSGDERNAADEEHADTTCAELGFNEDCGDGDFYDVWAMTSCPE